MRDRGHNYSERSARRSVTAQLLREASYFSSVASTRMGLSSDWGCCRADSKRLEGRAGSKTMFDGETKNDKPPPRG